MAQECTAEEHTSVCQELAKKNSLLEGYRFGARHGFDEAIAVLADLPPVASVADALKALKDHQEMWNNVAAVSVELLGVAGTGETAKLDQVVTPPGGSAGAPPAR